MSVILFQRPPRRPGPEMPSGALDLQEPPELPAPQSAASSMVSYAPAALGSLSMVLIFLRPGSGGAISYVAIGLMGVSAVGMVVSQVVRGASDRKRRLRDDRRDYLRYLTITRRQVRQAIEKQRLAQRWQHPEPLTLWSLVRTSRLWERRTTHGDFGEVRIGVGDQRLGLALAPLTTKPVEDLEPLSAYALRRLIRAYGAIPDQPIALYLRAYARVLVRGEAAVARAMTRALLCQLATFHSPEDLRIVIVTEAQSRPEWEWAKWLPHALHPTDTDGAGPVRLITDAVGRLERLLGEDFAGRAPFEPDAMPTRDEPHTVIVVDAGVVPTGARIRNESYRNTTVIDIHEALEWRADRRSLRLSVAPDRIEMITDEPGGKDGRTSLGRPDAMTPSAADALARLIAPYRMNASAETTEPLAADFELTTMLGITDLFNHDVTRLWTSRSAAERLRVPLGIAADGTPLELDIKESAEGGMGPHGLLIGATGSGKSELLRTLVLALSLTHSSDALNFVLVDFKGGATFLGLDVLPHTSAVITNLADEEGLVARMKDALHGELIRRQELLRSAGNYRSALDYETARAEGKPLTPLPSLFVVVDEFSELLAAHREFMELFIMIGRLGRSLGVHLLLASQRLDEGRMGQLESHLSYRIGLRTFSAMESRGVLGVPDAYQLPSQPGNGFLKTDTTTLTRFKAAYVSGKYRSKRRRHVELSVVAGQVVPYTTDYVMPPEHGQSTPEPEPDDDADTDGLTLLTVAADRLRGAGPPAHQVWLPPLAVPPTLDALLPPLAPDPEHGLTTVDWAGRGGLAVPIGVVDRPFDQVRDLLMADLSGAGGHVGIAGGPQTGKSTLLRSLLASLALTHTPEEVQFYCLDFGGGALTSLAELPHVGSVTGRLDLERLHRTVTEITSLISRRERDFAALGIDSMPTFRQLRAAGRLPDQRHGDVFLVIDGWGTVRQDFVDMIPTIALIANRGLNYGVHVVVTAARWGEIQTALRDQLGSRFELRLGDPVDSMINMRIAATVPKQPGRGMTEKQLHFLGALPRLDGDGDHTTLGAGVADLVEAITEAWPGPKAPPVRMLPLQLDAATLPPPDGDLRVALGIEENELTPFWHDFETSPHLMVIGDAETGKTNLLKMIGQAVTAQYRPDQARVALVDLRRELYDSVPEDSRMGYAVSIDVVRQIVEGAARAMQARLPGPNISPARLRKRDWWTGPQMYLIIDDYDMLGGASTANPFGPLLDYLSQGTELGLHVIVARSANGAARAMNDPLLRRLIEVNTPLLLLSCPPAEGHIIGDVRPRQLPVGRAQHITRRRTVQIQTAMVSEQSMTLDR